MTPEQRNAAIEAMADGIGDCDPRIAGLLSLAFAHAALDALLEAFVVLPRDDVTEEYSVYYDDIGVLETSAVPMPGSSHTRLVTRWQPITDKENA